MLGTSSTRFTTLGTRPVTFSRRRPRTTELRPSRLKTVTHCSESESAPDSTAPVKAPEGVIETAKQTEGVKSVKAQTNECNGAVSPAVEYPTEKVDDEAGGFFPVRVPGDFPSTEVSKIREKEAEIEFDPLRDGPLRYLGYANELGEAFAAWLPPGGVPFSYAVAVAYVLFDTRDKGLRAYSTAEKELENSGDETNGSVNTKRLMSLLAVERGIDTVVWQLLASVIIPGYTIHTVVAFIHYLLQNGLHIDNPSLMVPAVAASLSAMADTFNTDTQTVAGLVEKSVPTFCGLATIPFIVHPIDETVHAILNVSMRPALRKYLCDDGQGRTAGLKICDEMCMTKDFPVLSEETNLIEAFTQSFDE